MTRADLTEKILDIKREKGWTWKFVCEAIGSIAGASGRRVGRPDEADQAAGSESGRAVRAHQVGAGDAQ